MMTAGHFPSSLLPSIYGNMFAGLQFVPKNKLNFSQLLSNCQTFQKQLGDFGETNLKHKKSLANSFSAKVFESVD